MAAITGHGNLVDGQVQCQCFVGEVGGEHVPGQIRAGAEHRALTGQDDGADVLLTGVLDGFPQAVNQFTVQRISALGALHLDRHDVFVAGDTDHVATLIGMSCPPRL